MGAYGDFDVYDADGENHHDNVEVFVATDSRACGVCAMKAGDELCVGPCDNNVGACCAALCRALLRSGVPLGRHEPNP